MSSRRNRQPNNPQRQSGNSREPRSRSRASRSSSSGLSSLSLGNLDQPHAIPHPSMNMTLSEIEAMFTEAQELPYYRDSNQRAGRARHASSHRASSPARSSQSHSGIASHPRESLPDFTCLVEENPSTAYPIQRRHFSNAVEPTGSNVRAVSNSEPGAVTSSATEAAQPTASRKRTVSSSGPSKRNTVDKRNRRECSKCGTAFANRTQARTHQGSCQAMHKCPDCSYSTSYVRQAARHRKTHIRRTCVHCNAKFNSSEALEAHIREKHHVSRAYPCKHCGKILATSSTLRTHVKQEHAFEGEVGCRFCSRRFSTIRGMNQHISSSHPSPKSSTVCNICGKELFTKANLTRHKEKHRQQS